MSKEEVFLRDVKKPSRNWEIDFNLNPEDGKWVYPSIIGSFVLLIIMNFIIPVTPISKLPFDLTEGLVSVFMILIGTGGLVTFLCNVRVGDLTAILISFLGLLISLVLLYFGLPILFGFAW